MKRIGLSHRVDNIESYGERRDSIDQEWYKLLLSMNYLPIPLPNINKEYVELIASELKLDGLILTGGNSLSYLDKSAKDVSTERDEFESAILDFMYSRNIPVIGVCRGMQLINHSLGGVNSKVHSHVAVRHELINLSESLILPKCVNSFHGWGVTENDLAVQLKPIGTDLQGNIEAFVNEEETILGIMWHPERESPFNQLDINLLKRILK